MRTFPILLLAVAVAACGCTGERGVGTSESNRTGDREQAEMPVDKTPCGDPGLNGEAEEKAPPPEQAGKTPGPAIINFEEIDRLIPLLDSDNYEERENAQEKLLSIGTTSGLHAETLGPYLLKCSEQEESAHVRACLSAILNTLSSVSVSLIRSEMSSSYGPRVPSLRRAIIIDNEVDLRGYYFKGVSTDFKNRFLLYVELGPYPHIPVEFRFISARRDFSSSVITVNVDADDTSRGVVRPMCTNVTGFFSIEQTSYPILVCHAKYKDSLSKPTKGITKTILLKATPGEAKQLVKGEQTVEELKKLLGHENYFVRRDAVRALGRIATPDAISAVVEHLKSEKHDLVKRWSAIVLGRAGAKEAIPTLKAAFDPEMRTSAAFSQYIFWALIKLEAGGLEGRWAYNAYADNKFLPMLRYAGWEYCLETKKDYNKLTDAEQLALLKRAADEFEARYLKETQASSGK